MSFQSLTHFSTMINIYISDQTREFFDAFSHAAEQSLTALYKARNGPPPRDECLMSILKPNGLTPATSDDMSNVVVWYNPGCNALMPTLRRKEGCKTKMRWVISSCFFPSQLLVKLMPSDPSRSSSTTTPLLSPWRYESTTTLGASLRRSKGRLMFESRKLLARRRT